MRRSLSLPFAQLLLWGHASVLRTWDPLVAGTPGDVVLPGMCPLEGLYNIHSQNIVFLVVSHQFLLS